MKILLQSVGAGDKKSKNPIFLCTSFMMTTSNEMPNPSTFHNIFTQIKNQEQK